ncbi:MAG: division/cell wall cluster transcriptional repressor MraZ [Gammaproteobacteria bacterium]|jgi:MraZ protein
MFRGINNINLDDKGRIAIPTRCREMLDVCCSNNQLIITIDTEERCLLMYPLTCWEDIEKKIESLPSFNYAARRIQRLLIGHATEVLLDNQGRILLPQELREYAGLQKRAVLVGQGKKFEIWDAKIWTEKRNNWLEVSTVSGQDLPEEFQSLSL